MRACVSRQCRARVPVCLILVTSVTAGVMPFQTVSLVELFGLRQILNIDNASVTVTSKCRLFYPLFMLDVTFCCLIGKAGNSLKTK